MRPIFSPVKNGIFYVIFEKNNIKNQIFGTKLKSDILFLTKINLNMTHMYYSWPIQIRTYLHTLLTPKKEYSGPIPVSQDLFYDVIDPFRNILRILTFENAISSAKSKLFSKFALLLLFK